MDKNKIISTRFSSFSKYLGIIAAISFVLFLVINAFNTGNDILFWISYVLLMLALVGVLQSVCLFFMAKYYKNKK